MRFTRLILNTTLALSLPVVSYAQQPTAPAAPRVGGTGAPANQPAILPAPNQPGHPRIQIQADPPGQRQPGRLQPGQQPGQVIQAQPNQNSPTSVTANKPVTGDQANQQASQQVASLLAICNHKEVKLAELAKSKSENKDVQQFADMLINDHSEALGKLGQYGGQSGLGMTNPADHANPNDPNRADANRSATGAGSASNQQGLDFVAVHRQAAQQCLSKAQKKWSEHKSAECDMGYIGAQMVAHEEFINHAQAMRQFASPELQKEIDREITAAEQHRDEAHKLIKKLGEQEQKKS
jgi:predicted outer membrane protein